MRGIEMRWFAILFCSAAMAGSTAATRAQSAPTGVPVPQNATHLLMPPAPIALPSVFDGWVEDGPTKTFNDPAQADPANVAALEEYDFTEGALANYKRGSETLSVRAMRFQDVSGSYGAYSFYRQNNWPKVDVGTGGVSDKNRVLFWVSTTVVDANFSRIGPMSAGEMREIARRLPVTLGNRSLMPPILNFLPRGSLDGQTTHYAVGPAGYTGSGGVLPAELVGFDRGAEAITANYSLPSGPATLTIINYPTPQMAEAMLPRIRAYIKAGNAARPPWPKPLVNSDQASLEARRSGPLLAIVSGDAIPEESHRLIELVHYEADLTRIPGDQQSEIAKTGQFLMGIATLVLVGSTAAILLGLFLGGGRALYRVAHGKPASSVYDEEFIHLDLQEKWDEPEVAEIPHSKG